MGLDVAKLSSAVSRPGIDPREWLSLAVVTAVGFDAEEGMFADLLLQPSGVPETAYIGSPYAGNLFGDYCPLQVDDTVVVGFPGGDPGNGPVILCRFNNRGDPPHADFGDGDDPTQNRVIRVKPGAQLVIRTSESGAVSIVAEGPADLEITSTGGGTVQLGAAAAGQPAQDFVALASLVDAQINALKTDITTLKAAVSSGLTAIGAGAAANGATGAATFNSATGAVPSPATPTAATKVRAT